MAFLAKASWYRSRSRCAFSSSALSRSKLSFRLKQRRLKRRGVNFHQRLAFVNQLSFLIINLHELAVHAAFHRHRVARRDHAQRVDVNPDVALLRRRGADRERRRRRTRPRSG